MLGFFTQHFLLNEKLEFKRRIKLNTHKNKADFEFISKPPFIILLKINL